MDIGVVSKRYAKALLAYAKAQGKEDTVYNEVRLLAGHLMAVPELRVLWKIRYLMYSGKWHCCAKRQEVRL